VSYAPKVHIRDERFPSRAICGMTWSAPIRGGRIASDTSPPVVFDEERKSVNPASCVKCLELLRAALKKKK
jgi:hypothetical protein